MTGTPVPVPPPEPPAPPAVTTPPPEPPAPARTFTQDEVNALIAREKEQERRQAVREISERLGCTIEEAEQHLSDSRKAELDKLSEADRKRVEAEQREAAAAVREAAAAEREQRLKIREALVAAEIRPERSDYAIDAVKVAPDADDATIAAAVAAYKESVPEFFKQATPPPPPGKGTPSTPATPPPPTGTPVEDRYAAGAERAKARGGIPVGG